MYAFTTSKQIYSLSLKKYIQQYIHNLENEAVKWYIVVNVVIHRNAYENGVDYSTSHCSSYCATNISEKTIYKNMVLAFNKIKKSIEENNQNGCGCC